MAHAWRYLAAGLALAMCSAVSAADAAPPPVSGDYAVQVLADEPVAYWRFDGSGGKRLASVAGGQPLAGKVAGKVKLSVAGPRANADGTSGYIDFEPDNNAIEFSGDGGHIAIADTGSSGGSEGLKFRGGETITIEAWIDLRQIAANQNVYVIGKGRTHNEGFGRENQNWALRLRGGSGNVAQVSFLFRDADNQTEQDYHRWTSTSGVMANSGWHHVAVSYTFGKPASIRGYIDGQAVKGAWDMGGASDEAPVVDDDEVWIGSAMGGSRGNSFNGLMDEVAIYRRAVPAERMKARYQRIRQLVWAPPADLPRDAVVVQVIENIPDGTWDFDVPPATETYRQEAMAISLLARKYNAKAVIADRTSPFMVRSWASVEVPPGEHRLLLRSMNGSRLWVDGKMLATTRFLPQSGDGHHEVPDVPAVAVEGMRQMPPGHAEQIVAFNSPGGTHVFMTETFVGGKKIRQEIGELSLCISGTDGMFHVIAPKRDAMFPLTDAAWEQFVETQREAITQIDINNRATQGAAETAYWNKRHELARAEVAKHPAPTVPQVSSESAVFNDLDRYINHRLEQADITPAPLADDYDFLRRVTLDTVGVVPSPSEIAAYMADPPQTRRARVIDRLLADARWADHWTAYFQDVLAENPGVVKPEQNNTGPFRWWIHESLLDNQPMDRFATELILMEGSRYYGGPAGFEMATQNDVPMAEKAHVVGQAFLGVEMKCARCHDAPYHDVKQEDLFKLAAMLKRGPQEVPNSSTIPLSKEQIRKLLVTVTLEPGSKVEPGWPFAKWMDADLEKMPAGVVRNAKDTREQLAALITWPTNKRFARVMANRMWKRLLGFGVVEPADDWETAKPSHPELLDHLAREFVVSGYNLKHLARLILNSHTYQRAIVADKCEPSGPMEHLFASPMRRRLSAEQVVDSLFAVSGRPMERESEMLTLDRDGRNPVTGQHNFGYPRRAWEFASMSNERDRPALAVPRAQAIIDVLKAFGWRESRANPVTTRETTPTVQEPALLANGFMARWIVRLSEDHAVTDLALAELTPEQMVDRLMTRVMSRPATADEKARLAEHIRPGFERRIVSLAAPAPVRGERKHAVSWSNHLKPEATQIIKEMEREAREGAPPTARLDAEWRQRMEDLVWALINSPEFVMMP